MEEEREKQRERRKEGRLRTIAIKDENRREREKKEREEKEDEVCPGGYSDCSDWSDCSEDECEAWFSCPPEAECMEPLCFLKNC